MMTATVAADSAAPAPGAAAPRRKPTLLIVDDEEGPRQSLKVIFKDEFELLMAGDGPTAVELAQKHLVDVAITDIRMAGMSGIEVLERLKYVNPGIEVVMITAFETTDTMRQALQLQARLIDLGERTPELFYNTGLLLQRSGHVEDAIKLYREALVERPNFAEALLNLGHALKSHGETDEARQYWRQALEAKPELARGYFEG